MTSMQTPSKTSEAHPEKQIGDALATLQDSLKHVQVYSEDLHAAASEVPEMTNLQEDLKGLRDTLGTTHETLRDMRDTFIKTAALNARPSPTGTSDLDSHVPSSKNLKNKKVSDNPVEILSQAVKQLGSISKTVKQLSGYAGLIPSELESAVPTIAKSALSCSTQVANRLSAASDSLKKIKVDPENLDAIQSVSAKMKALGKAAQNIAHKDLSKKLMSQCHQLYEGLSGDGAQLKKGLPPAMTKIKDSVTSLSQASGIPVSPQLALALDTMKVVLDHIPDKLLDPFAAIFPLDLLEGLSEELDGFASPASSSPMASALTQNTVKSDQKNPDGSPKKKERNHERTTLKRSVQSKSGLFGSALTCAAIENIFSTIQAVYPLSVYVEFGPKLEAQLGVKLGWAAGFVALLGGGVASQIGLSYGLTVVNLMAVFCGLNMIILGMTRITLESIFVLSEV